MPTSPRRPRHPGPMSIDVLLADRGHKIRPLPIPPSPMSAPPASSERPQHLRCPSRPLPSLPESDAFLSVAPPTPPLSAPIIDASTHSSRSHVRPKPPPRFSSLSLKVERSTNADKSHARWASPPSPTLPEPPSPRTAQRKRASKLRRHLGESVQMQLRSQQPDVLAELRHDVKEDLYPSIAVESLDASDSDGSTDSEENEPYRTTSSPTSPARKWVRERGKQRYTEQNFSKIIQDLRRL